MRISFWSAIIWDMRKMTESRLLKERGKSLQRQSNINQGGIKMAYIDEETEREMMIRDIPLSDELKKKNPELYEKILKLRSEGDD